MSAVYSGYDQLSEEIALLMICLCWYYWCQSIMWRIYFNLDEQPLRLGVRVNSRNWDYGLGTPSLYYSIRGGALPHDPLTAYRRTSSHFYAYFSIGQPTPFRDGVKRALPPYYPLSYILFCTNWNSELWSLNSALIQLRTNSNHIPHLPKAKLPDHVLQF